jgi:pimeloyl-ACP methyl ester carboxylesterase
LSALNPRDQFITLNNLGFHYLEWGDAASPPLILLHGFSTHAHFWDLFARAMQDRFHVFALDARGHGESQWADEYSPQHMVEDLNAFITARGLERIALIGFSMGGRVGYMYLAAHPRVVERFVIVDIGPEIQRNGSERMRANLLAREVFDDPEEIFRAARLANPRPSDDDLRNRLMRNLMQRDDGRWTWRFDRKLRAPSRRPSRDPALEWSLLPKIACPTMVVRSAESDILSHETAARMAREIPDCRLVELADCGHSVPTDNPDGFLATVRPFLLG